MKKYRFQFTHRTESPKEFFWERFFGMIPGAMSWALLIGFLGLSFVKPLYGAMAIIAYNLYWLFRILYMTLFLVLAYFVLAVEKETDWIEKCRLLEKGKSSLPILRRRLKATRKHFKLLRWVGLRNQERELKRALAEGLTIPSLDSIYHVVIIAIARESQEVVEPAIQALTKSHFPTKQIIPVLAVEERTGPEKTAMAQEFKKKYGHHFFDFLIAPHPDGIPGEARVKGANVTFAAKAAANYLAAKKIPFENVVASCFDADTVASAEYFIATTYHFMRHPKRTRASFQPIPVYHNNIWDAPGFARVLETGSSFFQLIEATNPEKLVTFSSHSMSFKALVEIGYWPVDMISDDSAIFWKALLHYGGDYRCVPVYVTLSMDVVMAGSFWKTLMNVYKQKLRWAWGVENFPILMRGFQKDRRISLFHKIRCIIKMLEMHVSWASMGFIVTFMGWMPGLFATREFSSSVLFYNAAQISTVIFNLALTSFIISVLLSINMLPKHKVRNSLFTRIVYALEWLMIPFVFTFLSSMPALHAQTRLARGKAMEFWVTEKKRKA